MRPDKKGGLWAGQLAVAEDIVAHDFVGHWPGGDVHGPAALVATIEQTHAMFSRLSFTLEIGPIIQRDLVAARWTGAGTTRAGATTFAGHDILRVAEGRVVEYWPATVTGS